MTVTEFITARLDELHDAAMAASEVEARTGVPEQWQWECSEDDAVLDVAAALANGDEMLMHCDDWRTGLRSTVAYPDDGHLHHVIETDEPVHPADARHFMLNDPHRVVLMVAGLRRLMGLLDEVAQSYPATAEVLLLSISMIWSDHRDHPAPKRAVMNPFPVAGRAKGLNP